MLYLQQVDRESYENYRSYSLDEYKKIDFENQSYNPIIYSKRVYHGTILPGHKFCLIGISKEKLGPKIIGNLCYWHSSRFKYSKLINIEIKPEYRGKGYGTTSVKIILDEAKRWESMYISVFVFAQRKRAKKLYKKLGFKVWKKFHNGVSMINYLND